jgi:hypothetical protein
MENCLKRKAKYKHLVYLYTQVCKGKGKAIPLQAWIAPECFRKLRLPDFNTIGTSRF